MTRQHICTRRAAAAAVWVLLPGRTVAEVKAEALEGMSKWFQIASRLGTGEPDALAAQACAACRQPYPCPTIIALDGEPNAE